MSGTEVHHKFQEWLNKNTGIGDKLSNRFAIAAEHLGGGAYDMLEAAYAAGSDSRQWISVENGLPEIGKEVLAGAFIEAAFTDGRKTSSWQCCLQRWLGDKWVDADTGEEDGATHWMPLPDPPEKNL